MTNETQPLDYITSAERLELNNPGSDWRKPDCPRLAWFALGGLIGALVTWGITSAYSLGA